MWQFKQTATFALKMQINYILINYTNVTIRPWDKIFLLVLLLLKWSVSPFINYFLPYKASTCCACFRSEKDGEWSVTGDEHTVPVLVVLPAPALQQEDVHRVQDHGCGGLRSWA